MNAIVTADDFVLSAPMPLASVEHMWRFAKLSLKRLHPVFSPEYAVSSLKPTPEWMAFSRADLEALGKALNRPMAVAQAKSNGSGVAGVKNSGGVASGFKRVMRSLLSGLTPALSPSSKNSSPLDDEDDDSPNDLWGCFFGRKKILTPELSG